MAFVTHLGGVAALPGDVVAARCYSFAFSATFLVTLMAISPFQSEADRSSAGQDPWSRSG